MRRVTPLVTAAAVLALAAAVLVARGGRDRAGAPRDVALGAETEGPRLVLHGVDFVEIRPGGTAIRLQSDRASYAIIRHDLTAEGVVVAVPAPSGEVVVKAPVAAWDMDAGIVRLPAGGRAAGAGGWAAAVPEARLDLAAREMTAAEASLSGPGVTVEGTDLVWRWKDGTMTMDAPRGRVLPGKAAGRHG